MIVHKFGGTSVGSATQISSVVDIIIRQFDGHQDSNSGIVLVVSAMNGITDQLVRSARAAARGDETLYQEIKQQMLRRHLETAEELLSPGTDRSAVCEGIVEKFNELERFLNSIAMLGELTPRGMDAVVSFGEILSSNIVSAVIRQRGLASEAISATQLIVTDDRFGEAGLIYPLTQQNLQLKIVPLVTRGVIPVVTGYIGATKEGVTTTIGRGGSDLSAAILGAGLEADEVWIWSDVNGILTADPFIVPGARTLRELSYQEAAELAYYGADVLHPKTIQPVIENNIPLRILNSFNPDDPGTLIVDKPGSHRKMSPAIISTTGLSMIAVSSEGERWNLGLAARVLQSLSGEGTQVLMFSQSFSEQSLNLIVRSQDLAHCLRVLTGVQGFYTGVESLRVDVRERIGTVSVVGFSDGKSNGVVSHAYAALGKGRTQVIAVAQPATERSVSFCIPEEQVAETVRLLHSELGLDDHDSSNLGFASNFP
jgi:aspartokinase/homoserine dehydrogenase 1